MKRKDLIKYLLKHGCMIEGEGKKHTLIYNSVSNLSSTVPRHKEINTFTARAVCKDLGIQVIKNK